MNCMRCGKETEGKAVFCPDCLVEMERYPVKAGTMIHIPHRPESEIKKPVKKKPELPPEEQLHNAHSLIRILLVTVLGLLGALIIAGVLLFNSLSNPPAQPDETQTPMGRNYTAVAESE